MVRTLDSLLRESGFRIFLLPFRSLGDFVNSTLPVPSAVYNYEYLAIDT